MNNETENSDYRDDIVRFLADEMTAEEAAAFTYRLQHEEVLQQQYQEYLKIWDGVKRIRDQNQYDMDAEWSQLERKIDFTEKESWSISIRRYGIRIAAILLIGLLGLAGYLFVRDLTAFEKIEVAETTGTVKLQDGSEVTLNHDSRLRYQVKSNAEDRKVILHGEAYFEIARDTTRPFIIEAGAALVEVLGTSFNVEAYKNRSTIEVTVHSGIVAMSRRGKDSQEIILHQGNKGVYHKSTDNIELVETADPNDFAWKTRELVFSQTPLSEVVSVINSAYYTDITIENSALAACPITVTFSKQDLSAVLQVLVNTLDIEMKRSDGGIILAGDGCQ